jgi:hypothetical protein
MGIDDVFEGATSFNQDETFRIWNEQIGEEVFSINNQ